MINRLVAAALVLCGTAIANAQLRETRPVRGAYLRPPSSLTTLETNVRTIAEAGIQDLFLETFYHGLATNDSDIFNDRFQIDYLAEAIKISARYGVRVHAWTEGAYWSFSGSGDYILDQHPEWKVTSVDGSTDIGDIPGQVFVNLGHPGVQAMLRSYFAELAAYPGLAGIQTDYHRYPLDNNTGDAFEAPYSYDAYMVGAFTDQYGFAPPNDDGPGQTGQRWDDWVDFRRAKIVEAAAEMHAGINSVNPDVTFSGAIFPTAVTSSAQLVKMQDWPTMLANNDLDRVYPMAYGSSTFSISNDLQTAVNQAGDPALVVAALAILQNTSRPSISAQLTTAKNVGIDDFALFEATVLVNNPAMRTELKNWLDNNATVQRGDFDANGYIDPQDLAQLRAIIAGGPVTATPPLASLDMDADGTLDATDDELLLLEMLEFRFGEGGVLDIRDLDALVGSIGDGAAVAGIPHLYDLDGDSDVDADDQAILEPFVVNSIQLRLVRADGEAINANDTGPIDVDPANPTVELYLQAQVIGTDAATGLVTFDGQLQCDSPDEFTPAPLTLTEAIGVQAPGPDPLGRQGMFPLFRAVIADDNANPGNGEVDDNTFTILPLNLAAAPEGTNGTWANVYKLSWTTSDTTERTVSLTADGSFGGYLAGVGVLREPVPVFPTTMEINIVSGCLCEFDGTDPVDINDLLGYLAAWFEQDGGPPVPGSGTDLNADDVIDILDLLAFIACWFPASGGNCA